MCPLMHSRYVTDILKMCMKKLNTEKNIFDNCPEFWSAHCGCILKPCLQSIFCWCWFSAFKTKNKIERFFSRKSDLPCLHFHNGKSPSQNYFGRKYFIFLPISKIVWLFFGLLGRKMIIWSHFAGGVLEQGYLQKDSFQRMV